MGYLTLPVIIGILALPAPGPGAQKLADFSRLQAVLNQDVYLTDATGVERRLRLVDAGNDAVRLMVGRQPIELQRDEVLRVDRVRDRSVDGTVKGAIIGALMGSVLAQATDGGAGYVLRGALTYGTIGYLFDRAHVARQTVYRSPAMQP